MSPLHLRVAATAEQGRAKKQQNMEYWIDGILEYRNRNGVKPDEGNIVWSAKFCFSHFSIIPSFLLSNRLRHCRTPKGCGFPNLIKLERTLIPRVAEVLGAEALASATACGGTEGFVKKHSHLYKRK